MILSQRNIWIVLMAAFVCAASGCRTMCGTGIPVTQKDRQTYRPENFGEIMATDMAFDLKTGEIRYTLPEPAFVRLRLGINHGGALLRHLLDWEFREAGPHVETWDRKDATGRIDLGSRPDYIVVLNCRPITKGVEKPRQAPAVTVTFPEAVEKSPQGDPVVQGVASLRAAIEGKDIRWANENKFEVALYVDYVFLMEDETGTSPFNYRLDTAQFSEGEHTFTVNVIGYNGEVGTQTVRFWVKH